jgi:hypothetical protein
MKHHIVTFFLLALTLLLSLGALAQERGIPYQAVARDGSDALLTNQNLTVKFTLLQGSTTVYTEAQNLTTNQFGQFNAVIGSIDAVNFATIDWSPATSLQVEIDLGNGFIDLGTTELEAVPYAKSAVKVTDVKLGELTDVSDVAPTTDQVLTWNGTEWAPATPSPSSGGIGSAIAFGYIEANGNLVSSSGNVSATWNPSFDRYEVTITGESYFFNSYVTTITLGGNFSNNPARTCLVSSSGGDMIVYLLDDTDARVQGRFQFVTFKP